MLVDNQKRAIEGDGTKTSNIEVVERALMVVVKGGGGSDVFGHVEDDVKVVGEDEERGSGKGVDNLGTDLIDLSKRDEGGKGSGGKKKKI